MSGIKRDFSQSTIEHLNDVIRKNVDEDSQWGIVDWVSDWFIDDLNINDYINDIYTYHSKMCDKYDISTEKFKIIVEKVHNVDINYANRLNSISEGLMAFKAEITNITAMINPSAVTINENAYDDFLSKVEKQYTTTLEDVNDSLEQEVKDLEDAKEAYEEIPWYETAWNYTQDVAGTVLDYTDYALNCMAEGLQRYGAIAAMGGLGMMGGGAALEAGTAGGATPIAVPIEAAGIITTTAGAIAWAGGTILTMTTNGELNSGESNVQRAQSAKTSARGDASGKSADKASNLGENAGFEEAFKAADNYNLTEEQYRTHILRLHGSNSTNPAKSHFNSSFNIKEGIKSTLKGDNFIVKLGNTGSVRFVFEQTFSNPVGVNTRGKAVYTLRVVIDELGNVITAFPVK